MRWWGKDKLQHKHGRTTSLSASSVRVLSSTLISSQVTACATSFSQKFPLNRCHGLTITRQGPADPILEFPRGRAGKATFGRRRLPGGFFSSSSDGKVTRSIIQRRLALPIDSSTTVYVPLKRRSSSRSLSKMLLCFHNSLVPTCLSMMVNITVTY